MSTAILIFSKATADTHSNHVTFSSSSRPPTARGAVPLPRDREVALTSQLRAINGGGIHGLRVLPSVHLLSSLHNKPTKSILLLHTPEEEREAWQN